MYVCICAQVNEAAWSQALEQAGGDWHVASVQTGAGLGCGGCRVYLAETARQRAQAAQDLAVIEIPLLDLAASPG